MPAPRADADTGLVAGLAGVAKNAFGLFLSRLELASLELGEVRDNLARVLLVGALGVVMLWFTLACWTALVVVLAWDSLGWKILLLVAGVYTVLAAVILQRARKLAGGDRLSMPATLNELRNDRDALL
ncbi:phage holin family protein [Oxalobacteraceae bacterium OM1]|nr:phage holin family protein [Oxalobacteraceae bacterium OM1]